MTEGKRMGLMLGLLAVLIVANLGVRLGGDSFSPVSLFSDEGDLDVSPRAGRNMDTLESLPRLHFAAGKEQVADSDEQKRNPFIFGVDKRREQEAAERQARMDQMRREMEEQRLVAQAQQAEAAAAEPTVRFNGEVLGLLQDAQGGGMRASILTADDYFIVGPGQTLPGDFTVHTISEKAVVLHHPNSDEPITITLDSRQ